MADISKITLPDGETYNIDAITVEGHTVKSDVPAGAVFTIDSTLSSSSTNPVQNKVIYSALQEKIAAPASATSGQFLVYNGTAWVAQTVPSASGVSF